MSRPPLSLVHSGHAAANPGPASCPRVFDHGPRGRGRDAARRVTVAPVISRHQAVTFWADLVARRCSTREECAVVFGVSFQTACNWFDGFTAPTADKVLMALRLWPGEFGGGA